MVFQPFVPDKIDSWKVFKDKRQLFNLLNCINYFLSHFIDEMIGGKSPLIHLRTNRIPRGLTALENFFDKYNVFMGTNKSNLDEQVLEVNIGLDKSPRIIKLQSKGCMHEKKRKLESLGRE